MKQVLFFGLGVLFGFFIFYFNMTDLPLFVEDCNTTTLRMLQYNTLQEESSNTARRTIDLARQNILHNDSTMNRYFTISKDMVAYMYSMYSNPQVAGFRLVPGDANYTTNTQSLFYCIPIDVNLREMGNDTDPIIYYKSASPMIRPCPPACD
ncbi:MAG: hypothetical protein IPQ10_11455 [Saprospiraceae bacterium]|jgi:hypothetical protein|nr:hypothetical protein [Saprospiraceae bacterium]MBK7797248.1 hypothetical protein [Saprospiraceae bacterium]MBK9377736.1 hypothetical protein [Saprospiraceae bacterium]MBL0261656.1 hypothetical protein [Saprospiraceae bacterium]